MSDARATEAISDRHRDLDRLAPLALVTALLDDQARAVDAVRAAAPAIAAAVEAIVPRLGAGGRLLYAGAGTSGRLALLDAAELPPTFSWPPERAVALIAGGRRAVTEAVEGAEDDAEAARRDLAALAPGPLDAVIGIAASGTTPYAIAALDAARAAGALAVGIANNPGAPLLASADHGILLDTGPEAISGSTRMKAGTAQKIALNLVSTSVMVRLGKVHGNLMVDLRATNEKLRGRAVRLVVAAAGAEPDAARDALERSGWSVKVAIVMLRLGLDAAGARERLERAGGRTREALGDRA